MTVPRSGRVLGVFRSLAQRAFSPKYLMPTNALLGLGFMTAADTLQQKIEAYMANNISKPLDTNRTKSMMGGGLFFGIIGHYCYTFLDKRFPGKSRSAVIKKLACDVTAGLPMCASFFITVGALNGKPAAESWANFKQNILWICLADWGFYVPLQSLNFLFVPPRFRFLYVASLNLVYDTFLSFIVHKEAVEDKVDASSSRESSHQHMNAANELKKE